jgi:hypothetical protein
LDKFNSNYSFSNTVPQWKKMSTSGRISTNVSWHVSQNQSTKRASFEVQLLTPVASPSPALSSGLPNREEFIPLTPLPVPDSVAEKSAATVKPQVFWRFRAYFEKQ